MNEELIKEFTYNSDAFIDCIIARDLCSRILEGLKPTHAEVLYRCAVFEEEQQDIAEEKGVTKQAISRTYCLAVKRARQIGEELWQKSK